MAAWKSAGGYSENGNWQQIEPQSVNQALRQALRDMAVKILTGTAKIV